MSTKNFETTRFGDYNSEKIQSNSSQFFRQIETFPFFNGNLLKDIVLTTTPLDVNHKLNRNPQGYFITKRSAGYIVYNQAIDNKNIRLTATGTVTVDIWIY